MVSRLRSAAVALTVVLTTVGCTGGDGDGGDDAAATTAASAATDSTAPASTAQATASTTRPPRTTTTGPAGTTSTTGATTTTASSSECAQLAPIPAGAVARSTYEVDADADGAADQVTAYAARANPGEGDWHLRVSFAAGGGSDVTVSDDPAPGVVQVLGSAYLGSNVEPGPGGLRPAIFVWTGSGASARVIGLYRADGCELLAMSGPNGGPAGFVVGASVGHQEGLRCEGVAGTSLIVEVLSEPDATGTNFIVTRRAYTRDGNALAVHGTAQDSVEAVPPAEAGQIVDCGDVRLPG
ncbi:MAG: hypothetical protein IT196_07130 [Acidimicrobiales bacterium]|nr:hypothetical protein [Acidimicrobiales bacterium]